MGNEAEFGHFNKLQIGEKKEKLLINVIYQSDTNHNLTLVNLSDDNYWSSEYNKVNLLIIK